MSDYLTIHLGRLKSAGEPMYVIHNFSCSLRFKERIHFVIVAVEFVLFEELLAMINLY